MAGPPQPPKFWDQKILQIIHANPGWRVAYMLEDKMIYEPIVCWALIEEKEVTSRGKVLQTLTSVEPMIPGEHGSIVLLSEDETPNAVIPPGHAAVADGGFIYSEIDRKLS